MPGAEVFTISGASDEMGGSPVDAGAASPPVLLQNALRALGTTAGDANLTKIRVDGVVGPATVTAVNYALKTYVGSTPGFPAANLTIEKVRQSAGALANIISQRVRASGGTVPAPKMSAPRAMVRRAGGAVATGSDPKPPMDTRWIWWAVGGVGVLLVLTVAVSAVKKRRLATA